MLILTAKNPLLQSYGSLGYDQIHATLDAWAAGSTHRILAVDDESDMQSFGLTAITNNPDEIRQVIRFVGQRFPALTSSVLLVGGGNILPFFKIDNPVQDRTVDQDPTVFTDNPYGALDDSAQEQFAPSRVVGRLAVPDQATVEQFVTQIEAVLPDSHPNRAGQPGSALVVNDDWVDFSKKVATALPEPHLWHLAPGYEMNEATRADAARRMLYFNLHGFTGDPDWKCYSTTQKNFIPAVTPAGIDRSCVSGAISFAECCYGAEINGRTAQDSCALKLVQEGATFIGATGLAFGSYIASDMFLEDADFLARAFFQGVAAGNSIGSALATARKLYLNDSVEARNGDVWQYKQKTLLQFVLYGNPLVVQ